MGSWRVCLLGGLVASRDDTGQRATHFRTRKTASLLAFLAANVSQAHSRELLIERFWPESDLDAGRMSLRTALASLRKLFGDDLFADAVTVTLDARTDVSEFDHALRAARTSDDPDARVVALQRAVELYAGPLLPGFYDDWIAPERDRLADANLSALATLIRCFERDGDFGHALEMARRAVGHDALAEAPRADLIRLLLAAKRSREASRQYDEFADLLRQQLGATPSPALRARLALDTEPAASPSQSRIRLPTLLRPLIGRVGEIDALAREMVLPDTPRLTTLLGPGGIGKTRLSVAVAREFGARTAFSHIVFVALASATTRAQAVQTLALALEIATPAGESPWDRVCLALQSGGATLLILDNLEQCDESGALCDDLLAAAPDLRLLATSRHRLAAEHERIVALEPLDPADASALFHERARRVDPDFAVTDETRTDFDALLVLLDGFPLAIELAAGWAGATSLPEMRAQLERNQFALPDDSSRETRHHSLTNTIAWSVGLLDSHLRDAFLRLCVFAGGFDADAARTVSDVSRGSLAALRDRSLIRHETAARTQTARFRLHESLRSFGEEHTSADQFGALARAHADYFLAKARDDSESESPETLADLSRNDANLRAALARTRDNPASGDVFVELATELGSYWVRAGRFAEGREFLRDARARSGLENRAGALLAAARIAYNLNDNDETTRLIESAGILAQDRNEPLLQADIALLQAQFDAFNRDDFDAARAGALSCETIFREAGDARRELSAHVLRGVVSLMRGDFGDARSTLTDALAKARAQGNLAQTARALNALGNIADQHGEHDAARAHYEESLALRERLDHKPEIVRTLIGLGNVALAQNDLDAAESFFTRCAESAHAQGDAWVEAAALSNLAAVFAQAGEITCALACARRGLTKKQPVAPPGSLAVSLGNIADLLCRQDNPTRDALETAAKLLGAADGIRTRHAIVLGPAFVAHVEQQTRRITDALGTDAFRRAYESAATLSLDDAIALALNPG